MVKFVGKGNSSLVMSRQVVYSVTSPMLDKTAYQTAQAIRGRVLRGIHRLGRINTGNMIRTLQVRRVETGNPSIKHYEIASLAPYTIYQERGTPGHGPKTAKAMAFTPKGSNTVVFAKYVRGITPGYFFRDALNDASITDAVRIS